MKAIRGWLRTLVRSIVDPLPKVSQEASDEYFEFKRQVLQRCRQVLPPPKELGVNCLDPEKLESVIGLLQSLNFEEASQAIYRLRNQEQESLQSLRKGVESQNLLYRQLDARHQDIRGCWLNPLRPTLFMSRESKWRSLAGSYRFLKYQLGSALLVEVLVQQGDKRAEKEYESLQRQLEGL